MLSMGKSYMLYDHVDSLDTIYKKIESIKASDILEVANEILDPNNLSYLIYQ
jgi:predicted Zn-dependent peptidase